MDLPPPIGGVPTLPPVMPASGRPADAAPAAPATPAAKVPPLVELLDFVDVDARLGTVPVKHAFRRNGEVVTTLTIRRLVAGLYGRWADDEAADMDDLYGLMVGLPGPVIRGMDQDDRQALAVAAFDFLPLTLQAQAATASSATAGSGADTSGT